MQRVADVEVRAAPGLSAYARSMRPQPAWLVPTVPVQPLGPAVYGGASAQLAVLSVEQPRSPRTTSGRARQHVCFATKPAVWRDSLEGPHAIELDDWRQRGAAPDQS
jgi:hypothetical protein